MPQTPQRGNDVLPWAQQVMAMLRSLRVTSVKGGTVKQSPNGTSITILNRGPSSEFFDDVAGLQIINSENEDFYHVTSGTVNGVVPTLGGTSLDNDPRPEIDGTADVWVFAKVVGTFGTPDSYVVTIETNSSATPPSSESISSTSFTSLFLIGSVQGGVIDNDFSGGNLRVESMGQVILWWKT